MNPIKLNFNNFGRGLPETKGIYKIIALDKNGDPNPISRIGGNDTDGVLYIGKANNISWRIGDLTKAILTNYKSENHSGGEMYNKSRIIKNLFPKENLGVIFVECLDDRRQEINELTIYLDRFGELPPLNSKLK